MSEAAPDRLHNQPPDEIAVLRDRLAEENRGLVTRQRELLEAMARVPETIDAGTAGRAGDYIKQLTGCVKSLGTARVAAKEPYLAGGRAVDGFFKNLSEPLERSKKTVQGRLNIHLRQVEEEERRRREEEAKRAREEEKRLKQEAEEKVAKVTTEAELDDAVEAENAAADAELATLQATADAVANAAELSRTRGDYGSVASLRTVWAGEIVNRDQLDLEALRPHIPLAALEQAVRAFVRAGGRHLKGTKIYESKEAVVR